MEQTFGCNLINTKRDGRHHQSITVKNNICGKM